MELKFKKRLGEFVVDADVHDDSFVCLYGKNGSGKTSLLKVAAGILAPDSGSVKIDGMDVTKLPIEKRGIVLVTPDSYIKHLEVDAHLAWGMKARGKEPDTKSMKLVKESLGILYLGKLGKLSLGMRERVSLATALLSEPKAILVDEVFSSLDNKVEFTKAFRDLCKAKDVDVLFATPYEDDSKEAEHAYKIQNGSTARAF